MEITVGPGGVSILKDMAIETTVVGSVPMTIGGSSKMTALSKGSYPIVASVTWRDHSTAISRPKIWRRVIQPLMPPRLFPI